MELAGILHGLGSKVSLFFRHPEFLRNFDVSQQRSDGEKKRVEER